MRGQVGGWLYIVSEVGLASSVLTRHRRDERDGRGWTGGVGRAGSDWQRIGSDWRGNGVGLGEHGRTGGNRIGLGVEQGSDGKVFMKSNILIYA